MCAIYLTIFLTLHRVIPTSVDRRVIADPAIVPGRKMLLTGAVEYNLQASKRKKNTSFCQICHQNPADLCVSYAWLLRDTKCFMKILSIKNGVCDESPRNRQTVAEIAYYLQLLHLYLSELKQKGMGMGSAKERRRCYLMPSLIGRAHPQNDPWRRVHSSSNIFHVILEKNAMAHGLFERHSLLHVRHRFQESLTSLLKLIKLYFIQSIN